MMMLSCKISKLSCLCVMIMGLIIAISRPSESIAIHPAVLKNFVGPLRFRQQYPPVLRQTAPLTLEEDLDFVSPLESQPEEEEPSISDTMFGPRQEAVRDRKTVSEQNRAIRACRGNRPCRRNLDTTLNLLMRMMETGR